MLEVKLFKKKPKPVVKKGPAVVQLQSKRRKVTVDTKGKKIINDDDNFVDKVPILKSTSNFVCLAKNQRRKRVVKDIKLDDVDKFTDITASDEELSKMPLPDPRDYNLELMTILNACSANYNQGQEVLINKLRELKMELVKANRNHQAMEEKFQEEIEFLKQYIIDSNSY